MDFGMLMFITAIMSIIHIAIWHIFPVKVRDILVANPIFAFLVDLAGAGLIETFAGVTQIIGICNLTASVVFGIWAYFYGKQKGIKGLGIDWFRAWGFLPIFPKIIVQYEKDGKKFVL